MRLHSERFALAMSATPTLVLAVGLPCLAATRAASNLVFAVLSAARLRGLPIVPLVPPCGCEHRRPAGSDLAT
jgi:hypothetical protein